MIGRLVRGGGGEVGGVSVARHVRTACRVNHDTPGLVVGAAAQIGGIVKRGARGVELTNEDVDIASESGLDSVDARVVGGDSKARHVGTANAIDCNQDSVVPAAAAQVGRVKQGGLDME